jgi:hypothetical protein
MPKDKHKIDEDSNGDLANEHAIGNVPKKQTTLVINMFTRFKFFFVNEYFNHYEKIISSSLQIFIYHCHATHHTAICCNFCS